MVPMIITNGRLELWSRHIIKKQKKRTTNHGHTDKHVFIYFVVIAILNDVTAIFAKSINKQALNIYNNSGSISSNNHNNNNNGHDIGKANNATYLLNRNYYKNFDIVTVPNEITRQHSTPKNPYSSPPGKSKPLLTSNNFNNLLLTDKNFSNTLDVYNNKINFDPVSPNFDYNDFGFNDNTLSNNLPPPHPSSNLSNRRGSAPKAPHEPDKFQFSAWFNTSTYVGNDTANATDGGNSTVYYPEEPLSDVILMGVMSVILGILILITVIGNVFVIAAILLERNLQNVANYLIVSLAVADLMVACLVMPLGAVYEISRGWILGPELCDMWTSSDVLCCTASILHLVAIAVDRYWAVTNVDYIHTRNAGRIVSMIVVIWSVAIVVSLAPQFGWKDPDYLDRINLQQRCLVSQDVGYQIFATCSTFYVPLLVILVLYWKIFQTARKRIRRRRAQRNAVLDGAKGKSSAAGQKQNSTENKRLSFLKKKKFLRIKKNKGEKNLSKEGVSSSLILVEGQSTCSTIEIVDDESAVRRESNCEHEIAVSTNAEQTTAFTISSNHAVTPTNLSPEKSSGATATTNNGSTSHQSEKASATSAPQQQQQQQQKLQQQQQKQASNNQLTKRDTKKESIEAKREKKAAKTLAIITGAFVVCWLPFFIMALLMPLCESCYINDYLASFFLWLGYFNSTLNPVIYTIFSPEFRQAFKRILCGVSSARNRGRKLR